MCAIAGMYGVEAGDQERAATVRRMLSLLRHRGPDQAGGMIDATIAIGVARLSIVDPANGRQPMVEASGRYLIAFNGEIYNFVSLRKELARHGSVCSTGCDTEVLLLAWTKWGPDILPRLNGPFAFGVFDRQEHTLCLARDRFGKRPLYYLQRERSLVFASEMKAFLALSDFNFEWDSRQLASIFRLWTPWEQQSGFRRIAQLPPGSFLTFNEHGLKLTSYLPQWRPEPSRHSSKNEAETQVRDALERSVLRRFPADGAAGVYLSGGLDSAIVAALAARHVPSQLQTFSVAFEDSQFDESADQALLVEHLGSEHHVLRIGDRQIVDSFPQALWHAEVPAFRTAFVPMFLLSAMVADSGLKVTLTGEGADEVFLGYGLFREVLLRESWDHLDVGSRETRLQQLHPYLRHFNKSNMAALYGLYERLARQPESKLASHELRFRNSNMAARLLLPAGDPVRDLSDELARGGTFAELSPIERAQFLEFKTLLSGYLLSTQGDRMSMAHGVESRCPFLDPEVFQLGMATNLKYSDGWEEKLLLKRAFRELLPEQTLTRHKHPYRAPDGAAFIRCRPDYLELARSKTEIARTGLFDTQFCSTFVETLLSRESEEISQAENQAFVLLLSTLILSRQFVTAVASRSYEYADVKMDDLRNLERRTCS